MERKASFRPLLPMVFLFILINAVLSLLKIFMAQNIDYLVLGIGNGILFLASLLSYYLYRRALIGSNAQAFLRFVYGGLIVKMGICLAAALVYILMTSAGVNKYALLECFGFYFLYTFIEVKILMRLSKQQKNA